MPKCIGVIRSAAREVWTTHGFVSNVSHSRAPDIHHAFMKRITGTPQMGAPSEGDLMDSSLPKGLKQLPGAALPQARRVRSSAARCCPRAFTSTLTWGLPGKQAPGIALLIPHGQGLTCFPESDSGPAATATPRPLLSAPRESCRT